MSTVSSIPRVAIYCRVSSNGQEDNYSLDTQEEACIAYADEREMRVVGIYRETYSGASLWERPQLSLLRDAVRQGTVDVILCYALDRLSRKQTHVAILAEEAERHGAMLQFVTEDFEQSAVGTFLRSAKAFVAEMEREKIRERTMRGTRARATNGKLLPGPRVLYGYAWSDESRSALIPNPDTAPIVQRIFHAILAGGTLYTVASDLTRDGIPTPTGNAQWGNSTIRTLLAHPHYKGAAGALRAWHNGAVVGEENAVSLPEGVVPALVSASEWDAVQIALQRNRERAARNNKNPEAYLLRGGFVRCGHCGGVMAVDAPSTEQSRYRCGRASRPGSGCPRPSIRTSVLDDVVWAKVRAILSDPQVIAREVERLRKDDPTAADLAAVDRALAAVVKQQTNLSHAIAALDDADAAAPLIATMKELAARKKDLDAERDAITTRGNTWATTQANLDDLASWCATVNANIDALTYDEKRMALDTLGVSVTVYRKGCNPRWIITANVPLDGIENTTVARCVHKNVLSLRWTSADDDDPLTDHVQERAL